MWTTADEFSLEEDGQEMGIVNVYMSFLNCIINQMAKGFSMFSARFGKENNVCGR